MNLSWYIKVRQTSCGKYLAVLVDPRRTRQLLDDCETFVDTLPWHDDGRCRLIDYTAESLLCEVCCQRPMPLHVAFHQIYEADGWFICPLTLAED